MLKLLTVHFMPAEPATDARTLRRAARLRHELLTLAIGCAAAVAITLALYLVAPTKLREGIVTGFLGFDQPIGESPSHPPLPPSL